MFRNRWRYLLAIVGLLAAAGVVVESYQIYSAAEQQHVDYRYQPARQARRVILVRSNSEPKGYQPDCQNPQGNSNADLCAQWAAVDQVGEANRLSALNVRLSLFISLLTLAGTWFLVWTFIETRDTTRRQLRAYIDIGGVRPVTFGVEKQFLANVSFRNCGETPAYNITNRHRLFVSSRPYPPDVDSLEPMETQSEGYLGPGGTGSTDAGFGDLLIAQDTYDRIIAKTVDIILRGEIRYRDAFRRWHVTTYRHILRAKNDEAWFEVCETGNEAT